MERTRPSVTVKLRTIDSQPVSISPFPFASMYCSTTTVSPTVKPVMLRTIVPRKSLVIEDGATFKLAHLPHGEERPVSPANATTKAHFTTEENRFITGLST